MVSKRLRYEILRRDGYTCRYCGASAPDVELNVDHVVPVALGGKDEPDNLVASCVDCNSGKSSTSPDGQLVEGVADDALKWRRAMEEAAELQANQSKARQDYVEGFDRQWLTWTVGFDKEPVGRPSDWRESIGRFHDLGLELDILTEAVDATMENSRVVAYKAFRYFCGICWRTLEDRQAIAKDLLAADDPGMGG